MISQLRMMSRARTALLVAFTAMLAASGCGSCGGCEAEEPAQEPDTIEEEAEIDVEEDTAAEDLEEAEKAAEEAAVEHAVKVDDQARMLAAELEGASAERQDVPRTRKTKARPGGKIDTKEVLAVFAKHEAELKKCYERALKRDPNLSGQVVLDVTIEPSGRASSTKAVARSMAADEIMFECMERQAQSWRYPRPDGGSARVRKPIRFSPDM
ncbi:MAG: AgmX/PglI C-terminal domain-containing protein [Myxococcota bacterium]